ncbi:MAG: hypothetical protein N3F09_10200 [Bacteroidia bacterium]|nr:hypothetical protein [Bacteroidia bacterium]
MPNRLKILAKTDRDDYIEVYRQHNLSIHAQWLAGAKASGLNYDIEYYLTSNNEGFEKFPGFCFSNLTLPAFQYSLSLGSGRLDEEGNTVWPFQINLNDKVPGMLNCLFKIRVFEGGGGFSSDAFSVKASPFTSYAGFKLPFNPNNNAYQYLECGKSHLIQLASVWPDGKPKPNSSLIFTLHKLEWRWWWEKNQYGDAEYHSDTYLEPVASYTVKTNANGQAMQKLDFSNEEWGRYLISVRDPESGHVASREVYVDWANWTSRFSEGNQMSEIVYLKLDKDRYRVGDKAHVYVPAPDNAKVLLTVENSNGIISSEWVTAANAKDYVINITPEMFPNAYVYVSIIQPRTRSNNLPMRLYGLARLQADDPDAVLQPVLKMPDVLKPGQKVNLSISEKNGKEMEVTVAMVDEGLLDLTKFKTPDPLAYFSAVEAYVNRTWDHYSRVLGSFNADIQRILNVGGDMEMMSDDGSGVKRFKPMVRFVGPIKVKKGENKELSVQLPPYIGSLRTMVVAKGDAKFGSTEKTTPVKSDLMILGQAPRFCSMGDEFDVPVWVFTGSKPMKNIKLNIILQGNGKSTGNSEILCSLNAESQELKTFRVKATEEGSMKITVRAEYGNEKSEWSIDLPVILATPVERKTENFSVDAGKSFKKTLTFFGTSHQSTVQAEWTGISPIPFAYWMKQVKEYPYACAEQLSSNAISLMALSEILMLDKKQHTELVSRILHTQQQLNFYLTAEGGLGYWPGASATDPWISAYVLYFLKWCEWKNITVYSNLKSKLLQYNKTQSKLWYTDAKTLSSCAYSMQAFRLWVLSLFNEVDIASMNALARQAPSDALSAYFLALAYYQSGFHTMAKQQIKKYASQGVRPKADREYCYNSDLQAMAMELSYHVLTGNEQKALEVYNLLAKRINFDNWVSSFELAFGLSACVAYLKKFGGQGNVQFKALWDNQTTQAEGNVFAWSKSKILQKNGSVNFELQNTGKQKLNGTLTWFGKNKPGMETPASNGFNLDFDMNGGHQNLTGEKVLQGKDVYVNIRVTYTGSIQNLNHIALEIPLPAGWEWATTTTDLINAGGISGADYFELKDNKAVIYFNAISGNRYEFSLRATASYSGKFYWPSPRVMAMDNPEYYIYGKGSYIEVKENTPGENF